MSLDALNQKRAEEEAEKATQKKLTPTLLGKLKDLRTFFKKSTSTTKELNFSELYSSGSDLPGSSL